MSIRVRKHGDRSIMAYGPKSVVCVVAEVLDTDNIADGKKTYGIYKRT